MEPNTFYLITFISVVLGVGLFVVMRRGKGQKKTILSKTARPLKPGMAPFSSVSSKPTEPQIDKIIADLQGEHEEFVSVMRHITERFSPADLLKNIDLKRKMAHIELLLQHINKNSLQSTGDKGGRNLRTALIRSPDMRATMVSIVRIIQEMPEVREKCGKSFDDLVDAFLEKM
jgi:hypothetical protein